VPTTTSVFAGLLFVHDDTNYQRLLSYVCCNTVLDMQCQGYAYYSVNKELCKTGCLTYFLSVTAGISIDPPG
jgi:hypothetical protein